jgi:hypothetical protein
METDADRGRTKPYWVILRNPQVFLVGYDTRTEAEAEAVRLNQRFSVLPGHPSYYLVIPRPRLFSSEK